MPPTNDNLANATVVSAIGLTTLPGTTVDSTVEAGKETIDGYVNTIWYRIEPAGDVDLTCSISGASYAYYAELYVYPGGGTPTDFADLVNGYTNFLTGLGDGTSSDDQFIEPLLGVNVYYLLVTNWDFTEGIWGTFNVSFLLPAVYELDVEPFANLSSPTVSLQGSSPKWVRDTQFRDFVSNQFYKGSLDYTTSFEIPANTIPPGKYDVQIYQQYGGTGIDDSINIWVHKNGSPIGGYWSIGYNKPNGIPTWSNLTNPIYGAPLDTNNAGGRRWLEINAGDVISIHYGHWDDDLQFTIPKTLPLRYMEVQKIRFADSLATYPNPQWMSMKKGAAWPYWNFSLRIAKMPPWGGNEIYVFDDASTGDGATSVDSLGVWKFLLDSDGRITIVDELNLGSTGGVNHTLVQSTNPTLDIWYKDFTIMPNGDVYVAWIEENGTGVSEVFYFWKYNAATTTWSQLSDNVSGHGASWRHTFVTMDNDGTDVYIAWGEARQTSAPFGYWWRCKRWNVGAGNFTELGSGQTAYPSLPATRTVDAEYEGNLKLRISPSGVPWVCWPAWNNFVGATYFDEYLFVSYWNGTSWIDTTSSFGAGDGLYITTAPPNLGTPHGTSNPPYSTYSVSPSVTGGNYIKFAVYGFWYADLVFCHHDGPSENPAVAFQYVFDDRTSNIDTSGFAYFEYNGTTWENELYMIEGVDVYPDVEQSGDPAKAELGFAQTRDNFTNWERIRWAGGWTQGFSLYHDGRVPYIFSQKGYRFSEIDHVYAVKLKSDGTAWEEVGIGFADQEISPDEFGGWADVTTSGGLIVAGKPVLLWSNGGGWDLELVFATFQAGNLIPMHWHHGSKPAKVILRP